MTNRLSSLALVVVCVLYATPQNGLAEGTNTPDPASASEAQKPPEKLPAGVIEKDGKYFCKKDGAEMVFLPRGSFLMGAKGQEENPLARVFVDGYFIDKYETTNARYRRFVEETKHPAPAFVQRGRSTEAWRDRRINKPDQPVVGVTWADATAYCKWAGKQLPTQAQWEKAARGRDGRKYPWGDGPADEAGAFKANYAQMGRPGAAQKNDGFPYTAPVGKLPGDRSPYGVMDMAGNAAEWCADWFGVPDRKKGETTNPKGPATGVARVLRGGSWLSSVRFGDPLRCSEVQYQKPTVSAWNLGFRGVISLPAE